MEGCLVLQVPIPWDSRRSLHHSRGQQTQILEGDYFRVEVNGKGGSYRPLSCSAGQFKLKDYLSLFKKLYCL